jgi:hypothetical protein
MCNIAQLAGHQEGRHGSLLASELRRGQVAVDLVIGPSAADAHPARPGHPVNLPHTRDRIRRQLTRFKIPIRSGPNCAQARGVRVDAPRLPGENAFSSNSKPKRLPLSRRHQTRGLHAFEYLAPHFTAFMVGRTDIEVPVPGH